MKRNPYCNDNEKIPENFTENKMATIVGEPFLKEGGVQSDVQDESNSEILIVEF